MSPAKKQSIEDLAKQPESLQSVEPHILSIVYDYVI